MVDRRLGRGLDFFLSGGRKPQDADRGVTPTEQAQAQPQDAAQPVPPGKDQVRDVALDQLVPNPFQPRRVMAEAELRELADSIKATGILQPIVAREVDGKLQIVAGERRWRAAGLAKQETVPVLVRELSDQESAVFALVENVQREDLNAIEKAKALKGLMKQQPKATQDAIAQQVGLNRSTVANLLRLLELPEEVQAHVSRGTLSMGHVRSLLSLPDAETMIAVANGAIEQGLSVRALEQEVKQALLPKSGEDKAAAPAAKKSRPVWLNELEESLVEALSTPIAIRYGRKRSQIVIECAGRDEFERIFQRIKNA